MPIVARSNALLAAAALLLPCASASARQPHADGGALRVRAAAESDTLRLYYLGYAIGRERYALERTAEGYALTSDFDYVDRGRRTHVQGTMRLAPDWAMRQLEVARLTDTSRTVDTRIDVDGRRATVRRRDSTTTVELPAVAFAISPYAPVAQHLALLRYWKAHGSPAAVAVVPGGPTNRVGIWHSGRDTVRLGTRAVVLDRYAIDGVVWGIEYAWLDADGRLAAFTTAGGGGLSMEAIRLSLEPAYPALMQRAAVAAIADLERISRAVKPVATGTVAFVGATLIDGTGAPSVPNATVVIENGRIAAAGATVSIPAGARRIDVRGKTIVPGLWDMHTHLNQIEWAPVYLAAGVTTVRDMGNEIPFITALRRAVHSGRAVGPRMLLAGLVDGGGPNAFGAVNATTPEEGRRAVQRYHELGFEQMKLYSLLKPDVVGAITREAHRLGMTVTGHVPTSLSLLAAVDSGMDHIAHQPVRGDPASDSVRQVIAALKAHGTVIDPTASWGELLGHSTSVPVSAFQPVIERLPPVLAQRIVAMGTPTVDAATAAARLDRTLAIIRALHEAGVPIVAGTDEGIPGFSVYREIELYAKAGMSPMDAIRAATAVAAKAMRLDGELGTLEPGKRGDLVVLDGNPLNDIANIRTVRLVVKGGRVYESAALWRAAGFVPAAGPTPSRRQP
ncbi:MAG: amidohydrolase family protein [Gemmatimonadetes bacterium]|nr:amidohydrolase family protein [Gemmatimonadota bacterium]